MKKRHVASEALNARETLKTLNIAVGEDFHTLSRTQVDELIEEADRVHYRKPASANGSRARYFHDRLQRHAKADRRAK